MNKVNLYFFSVFLCMLCIFFSTNAVSALEVKSLLPGNNQNLYQLTCNNGKQHSIFASNAEQDFKYYYPNKGYYIKYYDMEFKGPNDFAEWVCRNK